RRDVCKERISGNAERVLVKACTVIVSVAHVHEFARLGRNRNGAHAQEVGLVVREVGKALAEALLERAKRERFVNWRGAAGWRGLQGAHFVRGFCGYGLSRF